MASQKPVVLMVYDPKVIVKVLNAKLMLGLTPENITSPIAQAAQDIYYNFVKIILSVPDSSLTTLPLSAHCADLDLETHRKSIPLIIVYQCLKAFIRDNSGGKLELSMCDFVTPAKNPQRFRRLVSFLVDFIRFHEMATPLFAEISDEFADRKQEMIQLQEDLIAEEKKKNELLAHQSARKRREHELINEHNRVKSELNEIVNTYTGNVKASEDGKKLREEALIETERVESDIISAKKMAEHLTGEVLSSPEELKKEMAARKNQIEELRDCLKQSKQTLQDKEEALKICGEAEKNIPVIVEKISSWQEMRTEVVELMDNVNDNVRKLMEMEEQLKFTTEQKKKNSEAMQEQIEVHAQLREQHLQRNEDLLKKIDNITKEIAALGKNQPDVSRDIEKKRQELLKVKNTISERTAEIENSIKESYSKYLKITEEYEDTCRNALEKQIAGARAELRVKNAITGQLMQDYTFNTSSVNENFPPSNMSTTDFNVFKP